MSMKKSIVLFFLIAVAPFSSSKKNQDYVMYHKFENHIWKRFNILQFEIPVKAQKESYDISFFAHITRDYEYDFLDFNMIMTTPSGEERIKEYHIDIKTRNGTFLERFTNDSSEFSVPLKKGLTLTSGKLTVQIENLVPRLETKAVQGVGIRLHPVR